MQNSPDLQPEVRPESDLPEVAPEQEHPTESRAKETSQRKVEANRINGAKGGVKTDAGKRRSRRSALKHAMRATTLLVEDETGEEGQSSRELREALEAEYEPRTTTEHMLVEKMVLATLRTRAGRVHEKRELARDSAFQYPAVDRFVRYDNGANKLFFKSLAELQKLQAEDVSEEPEEGKEDTANQG